MRAAVGLVPYADRHFPAVFTVLRWLHGSDEVAAAELMVAYFDPVPSDVG